MGPYHSAGKTYDLVIKEALEATRCVLVVGSQASIASDWVRAEADEGRQRRILVAVRIDDGVRLPLAFRQIQATNLVDWHGAEPHAEFAKVVLAVTRLLGAPPRTPVSPLERVPEPSVSGDDRQFTDGLGVAVRDIVVSGMPIKYAYLMTSAQENRSLVPAP